MITPTRIEKEHYNQLIGRVVIGVQWEDMEGRALPVILLDGNGKDGLPAYAAVLADPEGNGPGHLDHNL